MKFFSIVLLLITTGILFRFLSRPFEDLGTLGRRLQPLFRFPAKQLVAPVVANSAGSTDWAALRPVRGDTWRQAKQF